MLPHTRRIFEALAGAGVPTIHFGVHTGALLPDLARSGRRRDRRRLAHAARRGVGRSATIAAFRATSIRRCCSVRSIACSRRADDVLAARRRTARPHLQSRPRHPADDAGRARAGARATTSTFRIAHADRVWLLHGRSGRPIHLERIHVEIRGGHRRRRHHGPVGRAYELAQRGGRSPLLEASSRAGGLIRTEHVDGFVVEAAPDSLLTRKERGLGLCEELGLGHRLMATTPPRTASCCATADCIPLAVESRCSASRTTSRAGCPTLCSLATLARARRAMANATLVRARRPDRTTSRSRSFFRRRFGRGDGRAMIAAAAARRHPRRRRRALSMRSLFPRLADGRGAQRQRAASRVGRRQSPTRRTGMFRAFRGGMGELVAAIERGFASGSVLRLLTRAASRVAAPTANRVARRADDGARRARVVIVAAPAHVAARCSRRSTTWARRSARRCPTCRPSSIALAWPHANGAPSARRQRLRRRAASQRRPDQRVHVGLVEVGGIARRGGHRAAARLPRWRARSIRTRLDAER